MQTTVMLGETHPVTDPPRCRLPGRHAGFVLLLLIGLSCQSAGGDDDQRPNILFCIADDASWPHMSAYGTEWIETPAFDRVAREGLLFANAYTPNAKCAPSRACILTGRNTWQLEAACNHWPYFPTRFATVCDALAADGYTTGYTGKGWAPGKAANEDGTPRDLIGRRWNQQKQPPPTRGISNNDYAGNFADFLKDAAGTPWFFWYGSTEPHRRYEYGSGVRVAGKNPDMIDRVPDFWPDNEVTRNDMLDYALEIEHFDSHLGRMLELLEQQGQLDNTLIVVTSDNGMPFPRIKGQEYELSNHLPLAMMWPAGILNPGRVINDYVSFIDLAPTFLDAARIRWNATAMAPTVGMSLLPGIFRDQQTGPFRRCVVFGKERHDIGRPQDQGYPVRGIVADGWLFLRNDRPDRWPAGNPETGYLNCDGSPTKTEILQARRMNEDSGNHWALCFGLRPAVELYRIDEDRECLHNLAERPMLQEIRQQLAAMLDQRLRAEGDRRTLGDPDYYESMPYADDRGRNFHERYLRGEKVPSGWVNPEDFEPEPILPGSPN